MNNDVKESFRKHLFKLEEIATLDHAGPKGPPYGTEHGIEWHTLMEDRAKAVLTKTSYELHEKGDAGISLLRKLPDEMNISIICGNFLLYGYMCNKKKLQPVTYLWQGNADAVGVFYNQKRKCSEFVIVDCKVKRDLLDFWTTGDTFGMYLHQGILYAKLLQLHLELDYLPSVLLVPVSGDNGSDV